MTYEGEIPKSLIFMHHNPLILNVPVINEKLHPTLSSRRGLLATLPINTILG